MYIFFFQKQRHSNPQAMCGIGAQLTTDLQYQTQPMDNSGADSKMFYSLF